ncbi:hypothetical protein RT717_15895 [Imperialibacter roseus]|uniref:Lipoprotein n=1 Tax=Imperialibacter roseus TaxID=1324217 RepID=A0ABZ0IHP5_9BACT|nr:hypothetical protein [Imperialibacter roseus]WOK04564.1 hypothetical protein RT717_15895 [Imperialibacter roseus]
MRPLLPFLILAAMLGCGQKRSAIDPTDKTVSSVNGAASSLPVANRKTALALNAYRDVIDLTGYKDLGSFHFRRLHFYTRKNPGIKIGHANVDEITAYFIDRYAVKIRYKLSEDVASYLVDSLTTDTKRVQDLNRDWSKQRQIKWNYFSKIITYQNKCPDDDLALTLTNEICDSPYWLYVELPGYKKKVKELKTVENAVHEYLIDAPSAQVSSPD